MKTCLNAHLPPWRDSPSRSSAPPAPLATIVSDYSTTRGQLLWPDSHICECQATAALQIAHSLCGRHVYVILTWVSSACRALKTIKPWLHHMLHSCSLDHVCSLQFVLNLTDPPSVRIVKQRGLTLSAILSGEPAHDARQRLDKRIG